MKKEIPTEVKAKIFALYLGAKCSHRVFMTDNIWDDRGVMAMDSTLIEIALTGDSDYDTRLLLTPLSEISDEDAIEVARMYEDGVTAEYGRDIAISICENENYTGHSGPVVIKIIDFLRSRHYALPAFGYSVQDLIDSGVFKII